MTRFAIGGGGDLVDAVDRDGRSRDFRQIATLGTVAPPSTVVCEIPLF